MDTTDPAALGAPLPAPADIPYVDFLIVSYNTVDVLAICLASLEATFGAEFGGHFGVWVLDNASSDGTPAMVSEQFGQVRLVESPHNIYYGPAMNRLVRLSRARYVILLNPDTIIRSDIVAPMAAALDADPRVGLAYPALVGATGIPQLCAQDFPSLASETALLLTERRAARWLRRVWNADAVMQLSFTPSPGQLPQPMRFIWSTCCMLRRDEAIELGPFDPNFPMYDTDLDLCRRMAERGRLAVFLPDLAVEHSGGASSTFEQRRVMMAAGRRRYFKTHGTPIQAHLFPILQTVHRVVRQRHRFSRGRESMGTP